MTDLSDFDAGIDRSRSDTEESKPSTADDNSSRSYGNGRCPAITTSERRRCRAPVSRMNAADGFCGVHGREHEPWTIHDEPEMLILLTGRIDALSLDDVDPDDVAFDLDRVQRALQSIQDGGSA